MSGWHMRSFGDPAGTPILLLHGFTGHGGFWAPVAEALGPGYHCLAPDLPGHGLTPPSDMAMPEATDALLPLLPPGPLAVVGYSMGGRLALHLAARHPGRVAAVVAIGATAGLPDAEARSARRAADAAWARMLREEGLDAFLAAWEAQPLFASQRVLPPASQAWLRQLREGQQAEGLARSLETFGLGAQPPLHDALATLTMPAWLIAGEADPKFTSAALDLAARMPHASAVVVPGCGHNLPLENPAFLVSFLARSIAPAPLERSHA